MNTDINILEKICQRPTEIRDILDQIPNERFKKYQKGFELALKRFFSAGTYEDRPKNWLFMRSMLDYTQQHHTSKDEFKHRYTNEKTLIIVQDIIPTSALRYNNQQIVLTPYPTRVNTPAQCISGELHSQEMYKKLPDNIFQIIAINDYPQFLVDNEGRLKKENIQHLDRLLDNEYDGAVTIIDSRGVLQPHLPSLIEMMSNMGFTYTSHNLPNVKSIRFFRGKKT